MRRKLELGLAAFSLLAAVVHFLGELNYHQAFGQFLPDLWVDWLADLLLVTAAVRMWRGPGAAGPMCGAWAFTLCLNLMMFNQFLLATLENRVSAGVQGALATLGIALLFSIAGFGLSFALAWRRARTE
jgi:hypothetical protein